MTIKPVNQQSQMTAVQGNVQESGRYSMQAPSLAKKASILVLATLALCAASNVPSVSAGAGAYIACIQTCMGTAGLNWVTAVVCPTICAPFLLAPG